MYRDLLCVRFLFIIFFHPADIDLFKFCTLMSEETVLCRPGTSKCLLGNLTILNILVHFTHKVFVDVNWRSIFYTFMFFGTALPLVQLCLLLRTKHRYTAH